MKKHILLLAVIFSLALVLRLWNLDTLPPTLHRDEAFMGYNAFSLLKTGKEMTGYLLPIHLRSFLYSPAGYVYAAIPSVELFGLDAFAIRFPAAFFGSLTIIVLYLLAKELFRKFHQSEWIALGSAFILAILPWHITLSRVATENVLVTFLFTLGVWLYLLWIRKEKWYICAAAFLSFFITLFVYQAPRSFLPLFLPLLFVIYFSHLKGKKFLFSLGVFFLTIVLPVVFVLASPTLSLRIKTLSITQNGVGLLVLSEQLHQEGGHVPLLVTRLYHNKLTTYTTEFLSNYFAHFSYNFLFTDAGLPDRYRVPLVGLLYVWELPLLLLGVWYLLQKEKQAAYVILAWLFLTPVGSALTYDDVPNLQRTLFMVIPVSLLISVGALWTWEKLSKWKVLVICCISILSIFSLGFYLLQYIVHEPQYRPWYRNDGYKNLVTKVTLLEKSYKSVVVTDRESAPTIFFLFYTRYSPALFQKETRETTMHDFDRIGFGNYSFSQEECPLQEKINEEGIKILTGEKHVLYVDSGLCTIPHQARVLDTIYRGDHSKAFYLVDIP